jgi:hypothetical protein
MTQNSNASSNLSKSKTIPSSVFQKLKSKNHPKNTSPTTTTKFTGAQPTIVKQA